MPLPLSRVAPTEDRTDHRGPLSLSLSDLEAFMKVARAGLTKPLKEGDYDGLVAVMGHLMKVKERQAATDSMFEPLKQTIELLKSYEEELPEETYLKLQVGRGGDRSHPWAGGPAVRGTVPLWSTETRLPQHEPC